MAKTTDTATRVDAPTGRGFVGHEWDGIEELDTPMPRWWVITYWITILWAIGYVIAFPAWPLLESATAGVLGWSSHGQLAKELKAERARKAPMMAAIAATPIEALPQNEQLMQAASEGGRAVFKVNCVQCHGSGADGIRPGSGYPNLNDDDWLWGGDIASIHYTVTNGVRQPNHSQTRMSQMPAFGGAMPDAQVDQLVSYVRSISGQEKAGASAAAGAQVFADNCVACHGPDGKGLRQFGAPNLTDGIWLYGGDRAAIRQTILKSRYGVMPRWDQRLDPVTIKMLAAFVYSLGGGEASPAPSSQAAPQQAAPKQAANVQP